MFFFLIFIVALVKGFYFSRLGLNLFDYGENLHNYLRLGWGDILYKDIASEFPPGDNYFPYFILKIFGNYVLAVGLVESALYALFIVIFLIIVKDLIRKPFQLLIASILIFSGLHLFTRFYYLFFYTSILLTLFHIRSRKSELVFLSGLFLGIGSLFRHDTTISAGVSLVVTLYASFKYYQEEFFLSKLIKSYIVLFCGWLTIVLPVILWLLLQGTLVKFLSYAFIGVLGVSSQISSGFNINQVLSWPLDLAKAERLFTFFQYLLFVSVYPLTIFTYRKIFKRQYAFSINDLPVIALLVFGILQTPYTFSVIEAGHLYKGGLPALGLGILLTQKFCSSKKVLPMFRYSLLGVIAIVLVGNLIINFWWIRFNDSKVDLKQGTFMLNSQYQKGSTLPTAKTVKDSLDFIDQNSKYGDYVFLAPYHAMLYYLSERNTPSRFNNFAVGYLDEKEQKNILENFEKRDVKVVVYDPINGAEGKSFSSSYPILHKYILENFAIVKTTPEGWLLMLKNKYRDN